MAAAAAAKLITIEPTVSHGTDIAVIMIQGALCDHAGYTDLMEEVQAQGAKMGQRIWIGIPSFAANSPDPVTIGGKVSGAVEELKSMGFTGDNVVLAGHSLGGVMAQGYTLDHADTIKAQVLMGSVLTRNRRSINKEGYSEFDYATPTMAINGTKDGLLRISRTAESYWHTNVNVSPAQYTGFPTIAFEGISHAQFLNESANIPKNVSNHDLVPDVTYAEAHEMSANAMAHFFDQIIMGNK